MRLSLFAAARQMTVTGDWITPFSMAFDKPLIYWLMAIASQLWVNESAVRLLQQ